MSGPITHYAYPDIPVGSAGQINEPYRYETEENENTFHIGQCYEQEAAKRIRCVTCGGTEFIVGRGDCFTAIKCPKCEWETCIHDG